MSEHKIKPNTFQTPNLIADKLLPYLTGAEVKVILWITRKTLGWHKDEEQIAVSLFVKATGLSNRKVVDCLNMLETINVIIRRRGSGNQGDSYALNLEWEMPTNEQELYDLINQFRSKKEQTISICDEESSPQINNSNEESSLQIANSVEDTSLQNNDIPDLKNICGEESSPQSELTSLQIELCCEESSHIKNQSLKTTKRKPKITNSKIKSESKPDSRIRDALLYFDTKNPYAITKPNGKKNTPGLNCPFFCKRTKEVFIPEIEKFVDQASNGKVLEILKSSFDLFFADQFWRAQRCQFKDFNNHFAKFIGIAIEKSTNNIDNTESWRSKV